MLLIKQYKAQVLQLMLIRPSHTSRVVRTGLLEDIFDGGFSLESAGKRGTSDQDAEAAKVAPLLWVSPN